MRLQGGSGEQVPESIRRMDRLMLLHLRGAARTDWSTFRKSARGRCPPCAPAERNAIYGRAKIGELGISLAFSKSRSKRLRLSMPGGCVLNVRPSPRAAQSVGARVVGRVRSTWTLDVAEA